MRRFKELLHGLHSYLLSSIGGALTVAQIVLAFFLHGPGSGAIEWVGWICLWISGIFGYSCDHFPQKGRRGSLVDNLGVKLIARYWTSLILGLVSVVLFYADTFKTDRYCIEKFGEAYRRYIDRAPRVNFLAGVLWLLRR